MDKNTDALLLHMLKGDFVKGFVWRQFGADVFFVRRLRLAHFLLYDNAAGLKRMKGKARCFVRNAVPSFRIRLNSAQAVVNRSITVLLKSKIKIRNQFGLR